MGRPYSEKERQAHFRALDEAKAISEMQGCERIRSIMKQLYGLALFDALSVLVVSLSECIDQAPDRDAAWEAVLKAIETERGTIQ